ncbi:hypothetical protein BD414DRAFT_26475 [Trametes punicea]|nr:hypothetical protein BD414DRAFT_26475 [Trametes punicea]
MFHMFSEDLYTALPRAVKHRARHGAGTPVDFLGSSVEGDSNLPRALLLSKLNASIAAEEEALRRIRLMFDLNDALNLAAIDPSSTSPLASHEDVSAKPPTSSMLSSSVELPDKYQHFPTPVRTRMLPRAGRGTLRNFLCTPPRVTSSTLPEDTPLLGSPLQVRLGSGSASILTSCSTLREDPLKLAGPVALSSDAISCRPSPSLPPSPPLSSELPALEHFPLPSSEAESSPSLRLSFHVAGRVEPCGETRRSPSQGHRWPFPELITSGLRAAPCSPLLTTRAVIEESSPPLSSAPPGCGRRTLDPRRHKQSGLAFGVVQDFQRVLDQLQGLELGNSIVMDDTVPSSDQPAAPAKTIPSRPEFSGHPAEDCVQRNDRKHCTLRQHASDGLALGNNTSGPSDDSAFARGDAHASSRLSTSLDDLEWEFIFLLLDQVKVEEEQAEQLRTIANRLDQIANDRKHIVEAIRRKG